MIDATINIGSLRVPEGMRPSEKDKKDWESFISSLNLIGFTEVLAKRCVFLGRSPDRVYLGLHMSKANDLVLHESKPYYYFANDLLSTLQQCLGESVNLTISVIRTETLHELLSREPLTGDEVEVNLS